MAEVISREAVDQDWPRIYPFFSAIVAAGETYAYPEQLSLEEARSYWMAQPLGRTVVAVEGGFGPRYRLQPREARAGRPARDVPTAAGFCWLTSGTTPLAVRARGALDVVL